MREQGIRMKFNPLAEVAGKRLVVVDDSIVRGSTTRQIVQMLFDAGAAEVHVRVSSPPVVSPCFYGIDLAREDEMIAAHATVEEVREAIGATSLAYLSLDGLQAATARPAEGALPRVPDARVPDARPRERREAPVRDGLTELVGAAVAHRAPHLPRVEALLEQLLAHLALVREPEEQPHEDDRGDERALGHHHDAAEVQVVHRRDPPLRRDGGTRCRTRSTTR